VEASGAWTKSLLESKVHLKYRVKQICCSDHYEDSTYKIKEIEPLYETGYVVFVETESCKLLHPLFLDEEDWVLSVPETLRDMKGKK